MKRLLLNSALAVVAVLSVADAEGRMMSRFEWKRPLEGTFVAGEQGRLAIAGDVFGRARNFPDDLRIFGDDGTQWPFFIHVPKMSDGRDRIELSVLNKSFVSGDEPYLQFDLKVPSVSGKLPVHNQLELYSSGYGFVRRVEVFTGDGNALGLLASGYLIDFSGQQDARNRTIRYPDSDVGRLHVRIYPNAQSADETFNLVAARMWYCTVQEPEKEAVAVQLLELPDREKESDAQSALFDLGEINRPVEFVSFRVASESYARCVAVYGRNTAHDSWVRVGGGEIHQLDDDADNEIRIRARHRFLKVNVFHYDDQPLDITDIQFEAVPRYLVFEAAGSGSAALYFQGWDIKAPRYDLAGRIDKEDVTALPLVRTLEAEPNRSAKTERWRKYSKLFAGLAVGAVSLLVIWIIVSMLRQQKLSEDR